jgi:glycosyltransferase involved in cell wall biosynthesis
MDKGYRKSLSGDSEMKIVHVICYSGIGGAEIYALNLSTEANKAGHDVSFILSEEGALSKRLKNKKINYDLIPMESSFNPFKVFHSIFALRKYFLKEKIDIIHTHMLREHSLSTGAKFLGAKVKVVRTFHRLDQFNWKMRPLMWFYRWQTDAFIAVSEFVREILAENGIKDKVTVIYNGAPKVMAKKHEKAIGFLGRVAAEKGILKFIKENLNLFRGKLSLKVAGEGEELPVLKTLVKEEELNVEILGEITDLKSFFEKIEVIVLPTEGESTLPFVIIEAFSCGVPVVTFDIKPLSDLIKPNMGVIVEAGNFKEMGAAVRKLVENPGQVAKMSRAVQSTYNEKYTTDKMWQRTENLYECCLD